MTLKREIDGGPSVNDGVFIRKRIPGTEVVTADAVIFGIRVADEPTIITPVVIDISAGDGATAAIFGVNDSAPQILGRRRRF